MAITIPTVDEFTDSTVMLVIREIAEYICGNNGLVAQINNNDITGFTSSYTNNVLKIDATKGDGSTIPVCNLTIQGGSGASNPYPTAVSGTVGVDGNIKFTITMSSGSPLTTTINMNHFASTADLSDLQEQVTGIKPTVTTNLESSPPTITVAVNGTSSTANLPTSNGKKIHYVGDVSLSNYQEIISNTLNTHGNVIFEGRIVCTRYSTDYDLNGFYYIDKSILVEGTAFLCIGKLDGYSIYENQENVVLGSTRFATSDNVSVLIVRGYNDKTNINLTLGQPFDDYSGKVFYIE